MSEINIESVKDGCMKCIFFKKNIDRIRELRNQKLKETDYYLLPDVVIDEDTLNKIKAYRQQLRDFMNKLMNDEIECDIFDLEFETKYFPVSPFTLF